MPVRKPANRSGSHIIGKFPALKLKRIVRFESTIERDLFYLLDYLKDVTFFEEQPLTIEYLDGGKLRHYTPDVHAIYNGTNYLLECKPKDRVNDPDNQRTFAAALAFCAERGWTFQVITDRQLRAGFRLHNVKYLREFSLHEVGPQIKGAIFGLLSAAPTPPIIAQVQAALSLPPAEIFACLLHMAYHHELEFLLDGAPISIQTTVYLPFQVKEGQL